MTNEEAAAMLESMKNYFLPTSPMLEERREITALDLAISALSKQSASSDQTAKVWEMLRGVHDMSDVSDEAKDIIGDVMLMIHQMIVRADESIIADFVKYQKEWIRSHSYYDIDECGERAIEEEFLLDTEKEYIHYLDKLGQFEVKPGKNGEDRTRDDEGPKIHRIKLASNYYDDIATGKKTFELRKNDRGYREGHKLELLEFAEGRHTGRVIKADIVYMLEDYTGLEDGYCILGIRVTELN